MDSEFKILLYKDAVSTFAGRPKHRLIITNGCFDILHVGHVKYLEECRKEGDTLLVGVNADWAVKVLKGEKRPVNRCWHRMQVLAGLTAVDYVCPIDAIDVVQFIRDMRAAVWVKGGDYTTQTLNPGEVKAAQEAGTKIVIKPVISGVSTTAVLGKLLG